MPEEFDPYHRWLGISPKHQPPDHYRLLGIDRFEDDVEVIRDAAERQMGHVRRYQLGPQRELSQQILNELGAAKGCLLDAARKAAYDRQLHQPTATPLSAAESTTAPTNEVVANPAEERLLARSDAKVSTETRRLPLRRSVAPGHAQRIARPARYNPVLASPARTQNPLKGLVVSVGGPILIGAAGGLLLVTILILIMLFFFSWSEDSSSITPPVVKPTARSPQPSQQTPELTQTPEASGTRPAAVKKTPQSDVKPAPKPAAVQGTAETASPRPTPKPAGPPPPLAAAPFGEAEAKQHQQRWADFLGSPVQEINSIGMKLVLIPPGEFPMGSPDSDRQARAGERPQHRVQITKPFYLGAYEVTVGQFRQFVSDSDYRTDAEQDGKGGMGFDGNSWRQKPEYNWRNWGHIMHEVGELPVPNVSWNDADAFCKWLSRKDGRAYSLPTEAQWEYACRAGSATRYCFGDDQADLRRYAWYEDELGSATHPVGQKRPNAWGLHDMHGNVQEWCDGGYGAYQAGLARDPAGASSASSRVFRGGCWRSSAGSCRAAFRDGLVPQYRSGLLGFRVAAVPSSK